MRSRQFRIGAPILAGILILLSIASGIDGYIAYSRVHASAEAGMAHLKNAQTLLDPYLKHPTLPDSATMTKLNTELAAAHSDFADASAAYSGSSLILATPIPPAHSAFALLTAADELSQAGLDLTNGLTPVVAVMQGGFFATTGAGQSSEPQLTQAMLNTLTAKYESAERLINMAVANLKSADLSSLKSFVSAKQAAEIQSTLANWSSTQTKLSQIDGWLHIAPALLGMSAPDQLLVEVMDRAEMRATGGFIGAYAIMSVSKGKIQPFTLQDIFSLDTPYYSTVNTNSTPPAAYSWWPFLDFGLRDSNLSPDFPTSANLGLTMLKKEGGPDAQGVVAINETVIADLLKVTGPVVIPEAAYNYVTVNSSNLEDMIRLYTETKAQVDPNGLPVDAQLTDKHENFTALLGQQIMNKIHTLHGSQNAKLVQIMLEALPTKDMQLYFSDPKAESLVTQMNASGAIYTGPGDAVTIADDNVTGNKASALTTVTYTDAVTLDDKGAATHHLTITYHFDSSTNPSLIHYLYKKDYYYTYLRVYAPAKAKESWYAGFISNSELQIDHSDFPGRQMWGGLVLIQDGTDYTVHITYTVPAIVTTGAHGQHSYILDFQHQSGSNQKLNLTITKPGSKTPSVTYNGTLDKDMVFTVTY